MSVIGSYYPSYKPPSPPSASPPPSTTSTTVNEDGTPREETVIIVIGERKDDTSMRLSPYGGLSGAQYNAQLDLEFAMASPQQRAEMLGESAKMSIGANILSGDEEGLGIHQDDLAFGPEDIVELQNAGINIPLELFNIFLDQAREELSDSIENAVRGRAGELAAQMHIGIRGLDKIGEQVRVLVLGDDGRPMLRIYDYFVGAAGENKFIEVKTGGATRNARQLEADRNLAVKGGVIIDRNTLSKDFPFGTVLPPTNVDVWNMTIVREW
jgi:hypothetical protein